MMIKCNNFKNTSTKIKNKRKVPQCDKFWYYMSCSAGGWYPLTVYPRSFLWRCWSVHSEGTEPWWTNPGHCQACCTRYVNHADFLYYEIILSIFFIKHESCVFFPLTNTVVKEKKTHTHKHFLLTICEKMWWTTDQHHLC